MSDALNEHQKIMVQSGIPAAVASPQFAAASVPFGHTFREYFKTTNYRPVFVDLSKCTRRTLLVPHLLAREAYINTKSPVFVCPLNVFDRYSSIFESEAYRTARHVVLYGLYPLFEDTQKSHEMVAAVENCLIEKPYVHLVAHNTHKNLYNPSFLYNEVQNSYRFMGEADQ